MNQSVDDQQDGVNTDPSDAVDLGSIATLFQKWPGPMIMTVGMLLAFAATGIRVGGVEISGREFAGFEFGAVFFGGIVLIALGVGVLIARERLVVADEERRVRQEHELRMELGRAEGFAASQGAEQVQKGAEEGARMFREAYSSKAAGAFLAAYHQPLPAAK